VAGDLIVSLVPVCGAATFALLVYRLVLRGGDPPPTATEPGGGSKLPVGGPSAGPDDLARSA
jgi:hypothetical protein